MSENTKKKLMVACPSCRTSLVYSTENSYRPFCSERCQIGDRANWADESYRIPEKTKLQPEELNQLTKDSKDFDDDLEGLEIH